MIYLNGNLTSFSKVDKFIFPKDDQEQWWRCNDNEIRKAEFFEIEREGYGGSAGDPSAYILLYQRKAQFEFDSTSPEDPLSPELLEMVQVHDQAKRLLLDEIQCPFFCRDHFCTVFARPKKQKKGHSRISEEKMT